MVDFVDPSSGAHTEVNKSINNIKLQPDLYEQALGSLGSRRGNVAIDFTQETIQPKQIYIRDLPQHSGRERE